MSVDLGLVPMTPQTGHCARAASQALLKELLGKGLALPPFRKFISVFALITHHCLPPEWNGGQGTSRRKQIRTPRAPWAGPADRRQHRTSNIEE